MAYIGGDKHVATIHVLRANRDKFRVLWNCMGGNHSPSAKHLKMKQGQADTPHGQGVVPSRDNDSSKDREERNSMLRSEDV